MKTKKMRKVIICALVVTAVMAVGATPVFGWLLSGVIPLTDSSGDTVSLSLQLATQTSLEEETPSVEMVAPSAGVAPLTMNLNPAATDSSASPRPAQLTQAAGSLASDPSASPQPSDLSPAASDPATTDPSTSPPPTGDLANSAILQPGGVTIIPGTEGEGSSETPDASGAPGDNSDPLPN